MAQNEVQRKNKVPWAHLGACVNPRGRLVSHGGAVLIGRAAVTEPVALSV